MNANADVPSRLIFLQSYDYILNTKHSLYVYKAIHISGDKLLFSASKQTMNCGMYLVSFCVL